MKVRSAKTNSSPPNSEQSLPSKMETALATNVAPAPGKLERERGDAAGNKQMEVRDSQGFWIKGFTDAKGNSYTVDKDGSSTRMHIDKSGINYSESSDKAGNRLRITVDPKGEILTERRDVKGKIYRNTEKFKAS